MAKKSGIIKLFLKLIIAVLSIPVAVGVSIAFYRNLVLIPVIANRMSLFVWGIASYAILHLLFYKPTYLYVLGHEAVHAGIAWVLGGKVKSFKVSEKGGSVGTDKSNTLIELSPYFIPIYAIIIAAIYFVIAASYNINGSVFIFLIGFALAFHMISTIEVMKIRQPDFVKSGYFFSIILVYVLNIVVIAMLFTLIFPEFSAKKFFIDSWAMSKNAYIAIVKQLFF
ncbi:MAG: hypothetical protein PHS46_07515 [Candidatus Omnitrophica bacterium]|nr:hypothetical protein [Candidatus Omnitrophota bacterium]